MKTVSFKCPELIHVVGAMNDEAVPGYVSLRTLCGKYAHCEFHALADDRYATCIVCVGEQPDWLVVAKALGALTVRWRGSSLSYDLKIL